MSDTATGLARFLTEHFGAPTDVRNLSVSTAGARRGNVLFDAVTDGETRRLAATIMPTAQIQINSISTEANVRLLAEAAGVVTPHIHAACEDDSYVGGPFFISTRVDGETVPRRVLRLVREVGNGETIVRQIGDSLARLHAVPPEQAPAELLGSPDVNPCEVALANADEQMRQLLASRPAIALGLRWLERNLPSPPERRVIVHSDCRNGNLIIGPTGLQGILDWEGTRNYCDPMEDLAWPTLRMWRFRDDEFEVGGFAGRGPLIEAYEAAGGTFDADRFQWWKVLGTLRWGTGLAGQTAQHLDGRYRTIVMAASGRRVPELEWDLLMLIRPEGA